MSKFIVGEIVKVADLKNLLLNYDCREFLQKWQNTYVEIRSIEDDTKGLYTIVNDYGGSVWKEDWLISDSFNTLEDGYFVVGAKRYLTTGTIVTAKWLGLKNNVEWAPTQKPMFDPDASVAKTMIHGLVVQNVIIWDDGTITNKNLINEQLRTCADDIYSDIMMITHVFSGHEVTNLSNLQNLKDLICRKMAAGKVVWQNSNIVYEFGPMEIGNILNRNKFTII